MLSHPKWPQASLQGSSRTQIPHSQLSKSNRQRLIPWSLRTHALRPRICTQIILLGAPASFGKRISLGPLLCIPNWMQCQGFLRMITQAGTRALTSMLFDFCGFGSF